MTQRPSVDELIALWDLEPMETEGILFTETFTADRAGADGRPVSKAMIGLMVGDSNSFSDMHRLAIDEVWHFYLGDPIELLLLYPDGVDELVLLGQDVRAGERIQMVVPAGAWMGARVRPGGELALFGCTTAPGYQISDFEAGNAADLVARWPHRADLIEALTRDEAPARES